MEKHHYGRRTEEQSTILSHTNIPDIISGLKPINTDGVARVTVTNAGRPKSKMNSNSPTSNDVTLHVSRDVINEEDRISQVSNSEIRANLQNERIEKKIDEIEGSNPDRKGAVETPGGEVVQSTISLITQTEEDLVLTKLKPGEQPANAMLLITETEQDVVLTRLGQKERRELDANDNLCVAEGFNTDQTKVKDQKHDRSKSESDKTDLEIEYSGKIEDLTLFTVEEDALKKSKRHSIGNCESDKPKKRNSLTKLLRRFSTTALSPSRGSELRHSHRASFSSKRTPEQPKPGGVMKISVNTLPQSFVTKFLGSQSCSGIYGPEHTRKPVDAMMSRAVNLGEGEDLPVVKLRVSTEGIDMLPCKGYRRSDVDYGLIPIQFISYGVPDAKFAQVFTCIVVQEMSYRATKMDCKAFVCDSVPSAKRLALSVALAFQECSKALEGKPYKFQVDLKSRPLPSPEIKERDDELDDTRSEVEA